MTKAPWNKDKAVGQKKPLTFRQVETLREIIEGKGDTQELALLNTALDGLLRSSDLLKLKVSDVMDWKGKIKKEVDLKQKKTKKSHKIYLYEKARKSLDKWIKESGKEEDDWLFSAPSNARYAKHEVRRYNNTQMSYNYYVGLVKKWAFYLHIDPLSVGTHTMRRTKARMMFLDKISIVVIKNLLGQDSIESTITYCGVTQQEAKDVSKKYDF
jgi:integrase